MNISTGIKSRAAALSFLTGLLTPKAKDEKSPKLSEAQKASNEAEAALDKIAVESAIARVNAQPTEVEVVNVTIRTSAGPQELISVHIVKH